MAQLTNSERIAVVQEHNRALRAEVASNSESQRQLFRMALVGLVAVFALRKDLTLADLGTLLPIIPIVAMGVAAFWAAETALIFRLARGLAEGERKINQIAGEVLVTHEQNFWAWRKRWLPRSFAFVASLFLLLSGGYYWLVQDLMRSSSLSSQIGFDYIVYSAAVITHVIASVYGVRIVGELRSDLRSTLVDS